MIKKIKLGNQEVELKCSALVPRIYRQLNRDIFDDMANLLKGYTELISKKRTAFDSSELTIFENISWAMAKAADSTIPNDPGEWLDSFESLTSVYTIMPAIVELWINSNQTYIDTVKK